MLTSLNQMASISPMPNSVKPSEISKIEDTKPNSFSTDSTHDSNPKNQKYFFNSNNNKSYAVYLILYEEKMKILEDFNLKFFWTHCFDYLNQPKVIPGIACKFLGKC